MGQAPERVGDGGGGAGHQSLPLARSGHEVTIVDPSAAMLDRAAGLLAGETDDVRARVRLLQASGEGAPTALDGVTFDTVLCHGVIRYHDDPGPLVASLCELAGAGERKGTRLNSS